MKAYKILDSDGYTYTITETKPTEVELELIGEQYDDPLFTVEEVEAEWDTSWSGHQYLKEVDEYGKAVGGYPK